MNSVTERLAAYADMTERRLSELLSVPEGALQRDVFEAMRYATLGGGKRIRAALLLECCRLCCMDAAPALDFAAAVEMVHAYSLVHDDLPCMDDDDMRRGKPSCHIAFGEATALLCGDALLTRAFEVMAGAFSQDSLRLLGLAAAEILAKAIGPAGMIGGQVIDLKTDGQALDLPTLELLVSLKTGALIAASCEMGCVIGRGSPEMRAAMKEYAKKIGLAFQITDDILDREGDESRLGKPLHSDEKRKKTTHPALLGVLEARLLAEQLTEEACRAVEPYGGGAFLIPLAKSLVLRDH